MRRNRKLLLAALLVVVLIGVGLLSYQMGWLPPGSPENLYQTQPIARGYLAETVGQTGNLRARQSAILTWKTDGKVGEVPVHPGDTVVAGEVLARLDPTDLPIAILQAQSDLANAERDLTELKATSSARARAEETLAQAAKEVNAARDEVALLEKPNASPANILAAQAGVDLAKAQLEQAEQFYSLFEAQPEDNPTRLQAAAQLETARRMLRNAEWNLQFAQSKPDAAVRARAQTRLEVALAVQQDAQHEWERVKDGPAEDDLSLAQARVNAARAALDAQAITAPFSGTILEVDAHPGDLVKPAQAALQLHDLSEVYVDIPVLEVDINRIKPGQTATLTFDAVRLREYLGVVSQVAISGSPTQGIASYTVTVRLINPDEMLRPGLTAAVNIVTNQAEDALIVPNSAVRLVRNQRVVYILRDGQPVQVPIVVGIIDFANSQVISGDLQAGDSLILNPGAIHTATP